MNFAWQTWYDKVPKVILAFKRKTSCLCHIKPIHLLVSNGHNFIFFVKADTFQYKQVFFFIIKDFKGT